MAKVELLGMTIEQLEHFAVSLGEPRFRGRQLYRWIYKKGQGGFYEMSDIPRELRAKLDEIAAISLPRVVKSRVSKDGTRKFLLELADHKKIETVAIPQGWKKRKSYTLCLSTQVGCPLGCTFCATGLSGFARNLDAGEIVGQLLVAEKEIERREKIINDNDNRAISNLVFMGMGEPLLNYDALIYAIRLINDEHGINIGQRHITVSTAGIVPQIRLLAEERLQITLAISLHATTDEVRRQIMPVAGRYPLKEVLEAAQYYFEQTGRRVTFEYLLLDGVNTEPEDARRLAEMAKQLGANVNLIPYNYVDNSNFQRPDQYTVARFLSILEAQGVNVTLREEMGADIEAACGQLRNRFNSK